LISQGLLAALMLSCAEAAGAFTSVVVVRTAKEIAIAADSERVVMSPGGASANEICKIRREGHIYFSLAEVIKDSATGFDAYRTASDAAGGAASVQDAADAFQRAINPYLVPTLKSVRQNYPAYYQATIHNGSLLDAMFFGVEQRVPIVVMMTFAVFDWNASDPLIVPTRAVHHETGAEVQILWIGSIAPIMATMRDQGWRQAIAGLPPPQAAFALVNIALQANPEVIAPPIDVLEVKGDHARWIRRSRASKCRSFR